MQLHDLVDVGFGDASIPDCLRVNNDRRTVFALFKASGLIGAHNVATDPVLGQLLFERLLQAGLPGGIARAARMSFLALVGADKDVVLEPRHISRLQQRLEHRAHSPGKSGALEPRKEKSGFGEIAVIARDVLGRKGQRGHDTLQIELHQHDCR